jgi:hypothetical protein
MQKKKKNQNGEFFLSLTLKFEEEEENYDNI